MLAGTCDAAGESRVAAGESRVAAELSFAMRTLQRFSAATDIEPLGVVLFGSASRGELRQHSDIDLLVVLPDEVRLGRRLYQDWDEAAAQQAEDREVNPHYVHLPRDVGAAGSIWLEAAIEGQVIEDRSGQVTRYLTELRRALASGRFVRAVVHGHPYWRRAA